MDMSDKLELACGCIVLKNDETLLVRACYDPIHKLNKSKMEYKLIASKGGRKGISKSIKDKIAKSSFLE